MLEIPNINVNFKTKWDGAEYPTFNGVVYALAYNKRPNGLNGNLNIILFVQGPLSDP